MRPSAICIVVNVITFIIAIEVVITINHQLHHPALLMKDPHFEHMSEPICVPPYVLVTFIMVLNYISKTEVLVTFRMFVNYISKTEGRRE